MVKVIRKDGICSSCNRFMKITAKELCQGCYSININKKKHEESPLIECGCGCQKLIHNISETGRPVKYIKGHQPFDEKHWSWKGYYFSHGYKYVFAPYHPFTNFRRCVREHRLIYEQHYNCCLLPWIEIHHKNRDKLDNRIENLLPVTTSEHLELERIIDMSNRECSECGSDKTKTKKTKKGKLRPSWRRDNKGGFLCIKCYNHINRHLLSKKKKEYRKRRKQNQLLI